MSGRPFYFERYVMIEVIMPVFNTPAHLLNKSIKSVINQTYKDFKLWIIDDGSTDEYVSMLLFTMKKHRDAFTRDVNVICKPNGGVSSARNAAIEQVEPDSIIAYCDSDDVWEPNHLEDSMRFLEIGYDVVYSTPKLEDERGNRMIPFGIPLYESFQSHRLRIGNFIHISSVLHKQKGEKEYFDSAVDSLEDYDMWMRLFQKGYRFIQKPDTTVTYLCRQNSGAAGGRNVIDKVREKHKEFLESIK
jgi:glycosyltransferase involved in cell wall biosynthesis